MVLATSGCSQAESAQFAWLVGELLLVSAIRIDRHLLRLVVAVAVMDAAACGYFPKQAPPWPTVYYQFMFRCFPTSFSLYLNSFLM